MVKKIMFIRLKMATRSSFLAEKEDKQGLNDVSLLLFFKDE